MQRLLALPLVRQLPRIEPLRGVRAVHRERLSGPLGRALELLLLLRVRRAVVQRVTSARVEVSGDTVGEIGRGLVVFLGIGKGDGAAETDYMVDKITRLRVFEDDAGKVGRDLFDVSGDLLIVSQFTLYADLSRGRRPSFEKAMPPAEAEALYDRFVDLCRARVARVETGRFRAEMKVLVENEGPMTIFVESSRD
jgi:D-tyrosyl-tRNA(Tyr) deacylase